MEGLRGRVTMEERKRRREASANALALSSIYGGNGGKLSGSTRQWQQQQLWLAGTPQKTALCSPPFFLFSAAYLSSRVAFKVETEIRVKVPVYGAVALSFCVLRFVALVIPLFKAAFWA
eukprot:scaffold757_cov246-Pinguiococcus_pyrenoidosus.AAC.38